MDEFCKLLKELEGIIKPTFIGEYYPTAALGGGLWPEKQREAKVEFSQMLELGIIHPLKSR